MPAGASEDSLFCALEIDSLLLLLLVDMLTLTFGRYFIMPPPYGGRGIISAYTTIGHCPANATTPHSHIHAGSHPSYLRHPNEPPRRHNTLSCVTDRLDALINVSVYRSRLISYYDAVRKPG